MVIEEMLHQLRQAHTELLVTYLVEGPSHSVWKNYTTQFVKPPND